MRKRKVKGCSFALFPFSPNSSPVAADDPLHCGETDTEPFQLFDTRKALERGEELIRISHGESGAVISDEISLSTVDLRRPKLDSRILPGTGIFPSIADEVDQGHL